MTTRNKTYLLGLCLLVSGVFLNAQQQSIFTNYLLNNYAFNPAIAGSQPFLQANVYYRNQWTGFEGAPKTAMASIYGPLKKLKKMSVGGMVMSDKTGLLSRTTGLLSYSYHLNINKNTKVGFGLSAGIIQYNVKLYDVKAFDQGDEMLTGNILAANAPDANAGLYLYNKNFFFGFSDLHILNNKIPWKNTQGRLVRQFNTAAGYNFKIDKDFVLQPSLLIKRTSPAPTQVDYSLKCTYKEMAWLATSLRVESELSGSNFIKGLFKTNDALVFMIGGTVIKKINIAYAYDISLTSIKKYNNGSHEIFISYSFIKKKVVDKDEEEFKVIDNSVKQSIKNKKTKTNENNNQEKPQENNPEQQPEQNNNNNAPEKENQEKPN